MSHSVESPNSPRHEPENQKPRFVEVLVSSLNNRLIQPALQATADWSLYSRRIPIAAVCAFLIAVPFLSTTFPPITDLPQQTAQIRLFWETLNDPAGSPYRIQWLAPYNLSYVIIGVAVELFGYAHGGRVAMMAIAILWVVSIHFLAYRRNRPVESAVLASVFSLNVLVYWGFYSFMLGMPLFVIWFLMNTEGPGDRFGLKDAITWIAMAFLLYFTHFLWFVACCVTVVAAGLFLRLPWRIILYRVACLLPVLVVFVYWWARPEDFNPYVVSPIWRTHYADRASLGMVVHFALGGLSGVAPHIVILGIVAWIVIGARQKWQNIWAEMDKGLFLTAVMVFGGVLILPDQVDISVLVWQRWLPVAAVFFVLAMPAPRMPVFWRRLVAVALVAVLSVGTTVAWVEFQKRDLSGLPEALDALPPNSRVIGLDYCKLSPLVEGRPYLQIFAYAQALKGGRLNFSLAEMNRCLVVFRDREFHPWTRKLEWYAEKAGPRDVRFFDFVIACGMTELVHKEILQGLPVTPVTTTGRWRLYRVNR